MLLIFGLTFAEDTAMFAAWEAVFEANGYSLEELEAATNEIARSSTPPRTRAEHLAEINRIIRQRRRNQGVVNEDLSAKEVFWTCPDCDSCGWVTVPHPKAYVDGVWQPPFWSAAVTCHCLRGIQRLESYRGGDSGIQVPMSLTAYEARFPNWREEWNRFVEGRRKLVKALDLSETTEKLSSRATPNDLP
ncbi:MAG: hypothetical protein KatS3mg105_3280 [Gemmatales bacterium]|nr:MAG: hypothetical protein KatS3mg105_3280 [Gemmatales bacterium]